MRALNWLLVALFAALIFAPLQTHAQTATPIIENCSGLVVGNANSPITCLGLPVAASQIGAIAAPSAATNNTSAITGRFLITANDTLLSAALTTPGNFVVNSFYKIITTGNTDFTQCGAAVSSPQTTFQATNNCASQAGTTGTAGPATPFQGFRLNYTSTENWATNLTGPISLATISATASGQNGTSFGKGIEAFNVAFSPLTGYDGREFTAAGFGVVINQALNTISDFIGITGGITLNVTCELGGAQLSTRCHLYPVFATANYGPAAVTSVGWLFHGESGLASGALVQYEGGVSVTKNGSSPVKGTLATAGNFVRNLQYTITSVGNTDFTLLGALANTVGVIFTANGPGNVGETGTATSLPWSCAYCVDAAGLGGVAQAYHSFFSLLDRIPQTTTSGRLSQPLQYSGGILDYDNQTSCLASGKITGGAISNAGGATPRRAILSNTLSCRGNMRTVLWLAARADSPT